LAVVIATAQPFSGSPMTSLEGTNTSSRKISANPTSPSSWAIGRMVTPAARRSIMKYPSPRCRVLAGSVRNRPNARSAKLARELHVFCPDNNHPPSVREARARSAAMSLPASGSDQACAQISAPVAMGGSTRSRCSAVPYSNNVGASMAMPFWLTRAGAPAA
jgi:hypothetical protein